MGAEAAVSLSAENNFKRSSPSNHRRRHHLPTMDSPQPIQVSNLPPPSPPPITLSAIFGLQSPPPPSPMITTGVPTSRRSSRDGGKQV